jgi:hypothetical protein
MAANLHRQNKDCEAYGDTGTSDSCDKCNNDVNYLSTKFKTARAVNY